MNKAKWVRILVLALLALVAFLPRLIRRFRKGTPPDSSANDVSDNSK